MFCEEDGNTTGHVLTRISKQQTCTYNSDAEELLHGGSGDQDRVELDVGCDAEHEVDQESCGVVVKR